MDYREKRWYVGKNDLDRGNKSLDRNPFFHSFAPNPEEKSSFDRKHVKRKILAVLSSLFCFTLFYFGGRLLPANIYSGRGYLVVSIFVSVVVYQFIGNEWFR